ncbi:MAG: N-acetylmuramoyl-L-alanine amidase [Clostridia bacterium]|nr:N-acetylmuramoyl-L-alanine amidase [Clostridia bacterium]
MSVQSKKNTKQSRGWVRTVCVIFVTVLCCVACIGYFHYVTEKKLTALQTELSGAKQEIGSLQATNEAAQGEIDSLKSASQSAQSKIDALESANASAQNEIGVLQNANREANEEIDSLKSANQSAQREIESLKSANTAAQKEIASLKEDNAALRKLIEGLEAQIKDLQDSIKNNETTEKIRIYIDQGHNPTSYHNSGASGNGLYEQDLTFTIGCYLAQILEADGRFEVCLSRPTADTVLGTDNTSSLAARVQGAQEFGADYFISLHINAFDDASVHGIEVLVADSVGESYDFGSSLLQGLIGSTNLTDRGMKLRPELYVLKNATMPAALLEMGFITNPEEAALLSQSPELFAEGIYDGILSYFGLAAV